MWRVDDTQLLSTSFLIYIFTHMYTRDYTWRVHDTYVCTYVHILHIYSYIYLTYHTQHSCSSQVQRCCVVQRVAVYSSQLQRVAVCCSQLQRAAVRCSVLHCVTYDMTGVSGMLCGAVCCNVLQSVAACCSALRCVAVCDVWHDRHVTRYTYMSHVSWWHVRHVIHVTRVIKSV